MLQTEDRTLTITAPVKVQEETVESMIINASEFRECIGHWGHISKFHRVGDRPKEYAQVPLTKDGWAEVYEYNENADDSVHCLNRDKIIKGLAIMASQYPCHFADAQGENDDVCTADIFIQCCLFGEVKYG